MRWELLVKAVARRNTVVMRSEVSESTDSSQVVVQLTRQYRERRPREATSPFIAVCLMCDTEISGSAKKRDQRSSKAAGGGRSSCGVEGSSSAIAIGY